MDSTMSSRLAEGQIASLEEQLSNLAREAGFSPSTPPPSMKTSHAPPATTHRLADWRYVAIAGCLLAACIGVVAWWWSSSPDTAMTAPSAPIALAQAAPEATAPKTPHLSLLPRLPGWSSNSNRWRAILLP